MLVNLFTAVKGYGVPVTLREFLDLLSALEKKLVLLIGKNSTISQDQ
tara:strand:+ start:278 stop:418 length:141 start_codon:yes stop_codon:yes gene_type:complete